MSRTYETHPPRGGAWRRPLPIFVALLLGAPLLGTGLLGTGATAAAQDGVDFSKDIRPLLSDRCFHCHGPDENDRKAKLRLDTREGAFRERRGRTVIVPGKPDESELWKRLITEDEDDRMPPPEIGKPFSPEELQLFRKWIESGADWQDHWAFVAPRRADPPAVSEAAWPRNPIDQFILARLEREKLRPSPEADERTLIRRVTLDLTGLPPNPEEVEAFVADDRPDAYERLVDRLLASPRYGEHMARYWLDAARYGDTHGLHLDNFRSMWPYRDWVIRAYNRNMPFDQFTIEQLAGDLLPEPTLDQRVATGFNRCNVTTSEGGSIDEEFYVRYAVDRVETTATVWMGLTAGCAVCHDHKYDPLTQKEFYSLFAYFNNITEPAMDGNAAQVRPFVSVPLPGVEEQRARNARQLAEVDAEREAHAARAQSGFEDWLAKASAEGVAEAADPSGAVAHYALDGDATSLIATTPAATVRGTPAFVPGKFGKAFRVEGGHVDLGDVGDFESDQAFSYGAWVKTPGNVNGTPIARMDTNDRFRGWDLYLNEKRVAMHLIHQWSDIALKVTTKDEVLQPNEWHHVFVVYDGSRKASGVQLYVDGTHREHRVDNDSLGDQTTRTKQPARIGQRRTDSVLQGGEVDDVRIYGRALTAAEVAVLAGSDPIRPLLALPADQRTEEQTRALRDHWLLQTDEAYRALVRRVDELRAEDARLAGQTATTLVMEERAEPRGAYVLYRGEYDKRRDPVEPSTPTVLPPMPKDAPANRLGFARWLVDPSHPMTARVAVNRYWQQRFGVGIVKTQEDFGSQGEPPSHPQLLDWLATEFVRTGWDVKAMQRLIVTSATYRQSSRVTPELYRRDPENRLLARGPRYRLDAEALRDQALYLSGLLEEEIGGPSVKPPQPPGLWYAVGYTSSNTARFQQDAGSAIYRRSLYTFWKRTSPPPSMSILDAPSRESCTVRRERTNTPLQALLLMNETQYVEAARRFAERELKAGHEGPRAIAAAMFLRATGRAAVDGELQELVSSYGDYRGVYAADAELAKSLLSVGDTPADATLDAVELSAWTMVANLILNLDEVITKG